MDNLSKITAAPSPFAQIYFHGTKADLNVGDLISPGINSNYGKRKNSNYVYMSAAEVVKFRGILKNIKADVISDLKVLPV